MTSRKIEEIISSKQKTEEEKISQICELIFGESTPVLSPKLLKKVIQSLNQAAFKIEALKNLEKSFYNSKNPNVYALHHYITYWPEKINANISSVILDLNPSQFVYLSKYLSLFDCDQNDNLKSLNKVSSYDMDYEAFPAVCRMIIETLRKLNIDLLTYQNPGMSPQRFLALRGEMARHINQAEFINDILVKSYSMFLSTLNTDVAIHSINSFTSAAIFSSDYEKVLNTLYHFLVRDFTTRSEAESNALQTSFHRIFEKFKKVKKTEVFYAFFAAKMEKFTLNSPLKRWILVEILPHCSVSPEELIELAQEQSNQGFVSKCVSAIASTEIGDKLFDICFSTSSYINLEPILSPLFLSRPELISKARALVGSDEWFRLIIFMSVPKTPTDDIAEIREMLHTSAARWEVRLRKLRLFVRMGFPQSSQDVNDFLRNLDSLLFTESQVMQSAIVTEFVVLAHSLSHFSKRHSQINVDDFVSSLLVSFEKLTRPTQSGCMRKFGHDLLNAVYKSFPTRKPSQSSTKKEKVVIREMPDFSKLSEFRLLLEDADVEIEDAVPRLLEYAKQDPPKDVLNECFLTVSLLCQKGSKYAKEAAVFIFDSLVDTRKVGLVRLMSESLREVVSLCYNSDLPAQLCDRLIDLLGEYDMSSMRRSAGLPFIAQALIKSEPANSKLRIFERLSMALVELVERTTNEQEVANALNVLGAVVFDGDNESNEFLSRFFSALMRAATQFHSWDAVAAVNHALVGFVRRIWKTHGTKCTVTMEEFEMQISGIKVLEMGLQNGGHAAYLSLLLLTMFPPDPRQSLASLVVPYLGSKSSRFRRIAARALAVVGDGKIAINENGSNAKHGLVLIGQEVNTNVPMIMADFPQPIEPKAFGQFQNDLGACGVYNDKLNTQGMISLIRNFQDGQCPEQRMIERIKTDLLREDADEAYSQTGLPFLAKCKVPCDGETLTKLILNAKKEARLAGLISLLPFAESLDIQPLVPKLFELATSRFEEEMVKVRHAIAKSLHLLLPREEGYAAGLFLVVSDIPGIRLEATLKLTGSSELESVDFCISRLSENMKDLLAQKWVERLKKSHDEDALTVVADELMIVEKLKGINADRKSSILESRESLFSLL